VVPPSRSSSTVGLTSPELNAGCSIEKTNRPPGFKSRDEAAAIGSIESMSMIAMLLTTASNEAGSPSARRASSSIASAYLYSTSPPCARARSSIAEVDCKHLPTELGHPACELAVPARDLEDPFSRLEQKEPFDGGLDEVSLPGRPGFHAVVPEGGQLIPGGADLIVQVVFVAHGVERRASTWVYGSADL